MENEKWILCPICKNKTRVRIQKDTIMKKFPLFCSKCRQETLIDVKDMQVIVCKDFEK